MCRAPISDCQPIVKGSSVVYCASSANMVNFYSIDALTGEFSKKIFRVAGDNATWKLNDGVLTISGTGPISVDVEPWYRVPVSSNGSGFTYSLNDNAWKPIREGVTKIIVDEGITRIPKREFACFDNLTEVEIKEGLEDIGEEAFYGCQLLAKIIIPASVTSIGNDFLWTGYFRTSDYSHVVRAKIYAPSDSYAIMYAMDNRIGYVDENANGEGTEKIDNVEDEGSIEDEDCAASLKITSAKLSGVKASYVYTGKELKPKVTVRYDEITLEEGIDYRINYKNNIKTGKAKITITGIYKYSGTVIKTFNIIPRKIKGVKLTSPKPKTIKVSWDQNSQASGYQIQYATNKKFTKNKKDVWVSKKTTRTKELKKLTKSKTYFVRIRAYKIIDNKKIYGSWSETKKIKSE